LGGAGESVHERLPRAGGQGAGGGQSTGVQAGGKLGSQHRGADRTAEGGAELAAGVQHAGEPGAHRGEWAPTPAGPPLEFVHDACGHIVTPMLTCPHCHGEVTAANTHSQPGPGSRLATAQAGQ
jgi:hypothetical protein